MLGVHLLAGLEGHRREVFRREPLVVGVGDNVRKRPGEGCVECRGEAEELAGFDEGGHGVDAADPSRTCLRYWRCRVHPRPAPLTPV